MKHYIMLTNSIRNVGGGQMYVANKLAYMNSMGWNTSVYFYNKGDIYISKLKKHQGNAVPELKYSVWSYTNLQRTQIIRKVLKDVNSGDEVVIESNQLHLAYWGELIALKCAGKNLIFILDESIPMLRENEAIYLDFKLQRKELLNSGNIALRNIFKEFYKPDYDYYNYSIEPFCSNVVDFTPITIPNNFNYGALNILSIGRLDKPYIKPMLEEMVSFTKRYSHLAFNIIFVGGDATFTMNEYIEEKFEGMKNVFLYTLGYLFPIPYDWIKLSDVSIASSNSVLVSAEEGVPTIAIDAHDFDVIGIYGYTTKNKLFRIDEPRLKLSNVLESVLIEKQVEKKINTKIESDDLDKYFNSHMQLLNISESEKMYFDVISLRSNFEKIELLSKRIFISLYYELVCNGKKRDKLIRRAFEIYKNI